MVNHYKPHEKDVRPWGEWEVLYREEAYVIKKLTVKPGCSLRLQTHQHRSEHWVVVAGTAEVTIGKQKKLCYPQDTVFIAAGQHHCLANVADTQLSVIELQTGDLLDEKDIIHYDKNYQAIDKEK